MASVRPHAPRPCYPAPSTRLAAHAMQAKYACGAFPGVSRHQACQPIHNYEPHLGQMIDSQFMIQTFSWQIHLQYRYAQSCVCELFIAHVARWDLCIIRMIIGTYKVLSGLDTYYAIPADTQTSHNK